MRRRNARPIALVTLPALAFATVALSNGQQAAPPGGPGGSTGSTTGSTGSTTGSTGSTSGGSTGGAPSGSWTVQYSPSGSNSFNGSPVVPWGNPNSPGAWYSGSGGGGSAGVGSNTSTSVFAQSSGTVNFQFTWSGSNPPAVSWLAVSSTATWHSDNGSGTATDAFSDPLKNSADGTGGTSSGIRVYRVTGTSFSTSASGLNAYASVSSSNGSLMNASVSVGATGFVTDKNASLARADGGNLTISGSTYTANTLLSWAVDSRPGVAANTANPCYQGLIGTYGGTWTKLSGGTTDNVNIAWSGASPAGGLGFAPTPGVDHHETDYPATSSGGVMPLANLSSCSPQTQDWKYSIIDGGDGTELDLTCHWICHFVYENFVANPPDTGGSTTRTGQMPYTQNLEAGETATIPISAGSLPATTSFEGTPPSDLGFTPVDKHVGIAAYQARAGMTTPNSWSASNYTVTAGVGGVYGYEYKMTWPGHIGTVDTWDTAGDHGTTSFAYFLDNESQLVGSPVAPQGGM